MRYNPLLYLCIKLNVKLNFNEEGIEIAQSFSLEINVHYPKPRTKRESIDLAQIFHASLRLWVLPNHLMATSKVHKSFDLFSKPSFFLFQYVSSSSE